MNKGDIAIIKKYTDEAWKEAVWHLRYKTSILKYTENKYCEFEDTEREWGFFEEDLILVQKAVK